MGAPEEAAVVVVISAMADLPLAGAEKEEDVSGRGQRSITGGVWRALDKA